MKKVYRSILLALVTVWCVACFDDKGNYDYGTINRFTVKLIPEVEKNYWVVRPATDTTEQLFVVEVEQTLSKDTSNLEYTWCITKNADDEENKEVDTTHYSSHNFIFPKNEDTAYNVRLVVKDKNTDVCVYTDFKVATRKPFYYAWAVLHGNEGNRSLGMVDFYEESNFHDFWKITPDAYESLHGVKRPGLNNAECIAFTAGLGIGPDLLYITGQDSVFSIEPYEMEMVTVQKEMIGDRWVHFTDLDSDTGESWMMRVTLLGEDGEYWYGDGWGYVYRAVMNSGIPHSSDYNITAVYPAVGESINVNLLWDEGNHAFYCHVPPVSPLYDPGDRNTEGDGTMVVAFEGEAAEVLKSADLASKELVWLGAGVRTFEGGYVGPAMALMHDVTEDTYSFIHFAFNDSGSAKVEVENNISLTGDIKLAVTSAFANQFFYLSEGKLHLFNDISKSDRILQEFELKAGEKPVMMKFRLRCNPAGDKEEYAFNRILAIAVDTPEGKGKIYEIFFTTGADIENVAEYEGFDKIVDMEYMPRTASINI